MNSEEFHGKAEAPYNLQASNMTKLEQSCYNKKICIRQVLGVDTPSMILTGPF